MKTITLNFKDEYRLEQFLSSETQRIFAIQTPDQDLEWARIQNILKQVQRYGPSRNGSGKSAHDYIGAGNQLFLKSTNLSNTLMKCEKDPTCANLIIVEFLESSNPDKASIKNLFRFIYENASKKAILICRFDCTDYTDDDEPEFLLKECINDICFQNLAEETQKEVLQFPLISYQEKFVSLKEFLCIDDINDARLNNIVNSIVLKQIICDPNDVLMIKIGANNPLRSISYIPRQFSTDILIIPTVVELFASQKDYPDIFIFAGVKDKRNLFVFLGAATKCSHKVLNNENIVTFEKFELAYTNFEMRGSERPVHLIKCEEQSPMLSWKDSKGSIENLRPFAIRNNSNNEVSIDEKELFNKKRVVLSGPPGIGKSTTLTRMCNFLPSSWVLLIDLLHCGNIIGELPSSMTHDVVVNFLLNWVEKQPLAYGIVKDVLYSDKSKPLYLFFDGFDEMVNVLGSNELNSFISLLQFLKTQSKANIYITTRPQNSLFLEDALSVFSTEFQDINYDEQKNFLINVWKSRVTFKVHSLNELILKYVEDIVKFTESLLKGEETFLGAPLLLEALAEVASPPIEYFTDFNNFKLIENVNASALFERLVKSKYQTYLQCKIPEQEDIILLNKKHGELAFKILFPEFKLENKTLVNDFDIAKVGLVLLTEDHGLDFIHRTFAEFFVADWIYTCLQNSTNLSMERLLVSKILLKPQYKVTRIFLNNRFKDTIPVISENVLLHIVSLWKEDKRIFLNKNGEWAFHVLINEKLSHLCFLFVNKSFLTELISLFVVQNKDGKTVLFLAAERREEELIHTILNILNQLPEEVSREIIWASFFKIFRSDKNEIFGYIMSKMENYNRLSHIDKQMENYNQLSEICFKLVNENKLINLKSLLGSMEDKAACTQTHVLLTPYKSDCMLLHTAASLGFMDIISCLIDMGTPVDISDKIKSTPLHYAASEGKLEVVKFLNTKGANLNICDEYSRTALTLCAKKGYLNVLNYLLENDVNINICDRNRISSLEHAAKSGHIDIVSSLLKKGCDINHRDRFGMSALAWAVKAGNLEMINFLMNQGSDSEIKDRHGMNLVHIAVKANHWRIVKYLTFYQINTNCPDYNGVTPLERAVKSGKWDMVEYLILEGATVMKNKLNGFIPVRHTLKAEKWQLILLMIERGADLTDLTLEERKQILNKIVDETHNQYDLFYKVIQLGNVELLKLLILQETHADKLDSLLAEPYEELLLRNVHLEENMKRFIEGKLVELRSGREHTLYMSEEDVKEQLNVTCDIIEYLKKNYSGNEAKIDEEFIIRGQFIAQFFEIVKRRKTFRTTQIPFEEMEFCLLTFINFFVKPKNDDVPYRLMLDQPKIFTYLSEFADTIRRYQNKQDLLLDCLVPLKNDYRVVKDIYSLSRISTYINYALSIKNIEEEMRPFALMRCLQVIGESLKNTIESPNLSDSVLNFLHNEAPSGLKKILTSVRDFLSHAYTFRGKRDLEERLKCDTKYFQSIQNDLKKFKPEIDLMLINKKLENIHIFSRKCHGTTKDNFNKMIQYINYSVLEELRFEDYEYEELKIIKTLVLQLKVILNDSGEIINKMISDLLLEIDNIKKEISHRVNYSKLAYSMQLERMHIHLQENVLPVQSLASIHNDGCTTYRNLRYRKALEILMQIQFSIFKNKAYSINKALEIFYKIMFLIICQSDRIVGIEEAQNNLNCTREKNSKADYAFHEVKNFLEAVEDKDSLEFYISEKMNIHKIVKNKHQNVSDLRLVIQGLPIKNTTKNNLIKFLNNNEMQLFYSQLGAIDEVGKLLKKVNDNDTFYKQLKEFWRPIRNPNIISAVQNFIENEKNHEKNIYAHKLKLLHSITKNDQSIYQNISLKLAVEMLLLDVMDALLNILPEYSLSFNEFAPVLVNRQLRNYLAHGSILIDNLPFDPLTAIVFTAGDIRFQEKTIKKSEMIYFQNHKLKKSLENLKLKSDLFSSFNNNCEILKYEVKTRDMLHQNLLDHAIFYDIDEMFLILSSSRTCNMSNCFIKAADAGALNVLRCILHSILDVKKINIEMGKNIMYEGILWQAILAASKNGHKNIINELLSYVQIQKLQNVIPLPSEMHTFLKISADRPLETCLQYFQIETFLCIVEKGFIDIAKTILEQFYVIGLPINLTTALHISACWGHVEIINLLLSYKVNIKATDENQNSVLHASAFHGQPEVIKLLLKHNFDINIKNKQDRTPLHLAADKGHTDIAQLLLEFDANINAIDIEQNTPLHLSVNEGHDKLVEFLLKQQLVEVNASNKNGFTPLHMAAKNGNEHIVNMLLDHQANINTCENVNENEADVNIVNIEKQTPLHLATFKGRGHGVVKMFKQGANVNVVTIDGDTPLHLACQCGSERVVEVLIEYGANVNQVSENQGNHVDKKNINEFTPLHMTALQGHEGVAKILLQNKANVNAVTIDGDTPLHLACHDGRERVVEVLIEYGANVNQVSENQGKLTPLHIAASQGHEGVVKILFQNKANVNAVIIEGATPLDLACQLGRERVVEVLIEYGANVNPESENQGNHVDRKNINELTPLHMAALQGHEGVVKILPQNKANFTIAGATPLHLACLNGRERVVEVLIEYGANVNQGKLTPLHIAALQGHEGVVKILLQNKANVNAVIIAGVTPLYLACHNGRERVVEVLIEYGANVNQVSENQGNHVDKKNINELTPLHVAALQGHEGVVKILLQNKANVNAVTIDGDTPLHLACHDGRERVVEVLIEYGANVNRESENQVNHVDKKNINGLTPLHMAALQGHEGIVKILLQNKAKVDAVDNQGATPLHWCTLYNSETIAERIVKLLIDHGANVNVKDITGFAPLKIAVERKSDSLVALLLSKGATQ